MAATAPPICAATAARIIGGAAATANACPQLEQNAALSTIAAPHLEQNTVSPLAFPRLAANSQKSQPNPTFNRRKRQSSTLRRESGKDFIVLVQEPPSWLLPRLSRISLNSHALRGNVEILSDLVHFVPLSNLVTNCSESLVTARASPRC